MARARGGPGERVAGAKAALRQARGAAASTDRHGDGRGRDAGVEPADAAHVPQHAAHIPRCCFWGGGGALFACVCWGPGQHICMSVYAKTIRIRCTAAGRTRSQLEVAGHAMRHAPRAENKRLRER